MFVFSALFGCVTHPKKATADVKRTCCLELNLKKKLKNMEFYFVKPAI